MIKVEETDKDAILKDKKQKTPSIALLKTQIVI